MKKTLLYFFCCIYAFVLTAQTSTDRSELRDYFDFKAGETVFLFGDKVNIREYASISAEVLETLPMNTSVKVLTVLSKDNTPYLTLNGITAPWVKIQFGPKLIDGYVWAPLLAQYKIEGAFYVDFLFGLSKKDTETGQLYGKLRAIKEGWLLDEFEFKTIGTTEHYTYGQIYGSRGVPKVDNIIETHFGYEACGYVNGNQTFVWRDEKLYYLGKVETMGEAGLFFSGTSLIFPNENQGPPEKILIKKEEGEFDEIGNGTIKTDISVWDWTGTKLVKATN